MGEHETGLEPRQERSRRTLANLLSATVRTLHEGGLEGATIPRIAREAGVSPATVYRRFKDKRDLLRAAFLHLLEASQVQNRMHLPQELTRPTLAEAARRLVELHLTQFRRNGPLLGALRQFMQADGDSEFVQAARRIVEGNLDLAIQAMLRYRKEMSHPQPERAVRIATLTTANAIETLTCMPRSAWRTLQPMSDDALIEELTRGYVAYLKMPD